MAKLTCISGAGAKEAACFLYEVADKRIMLDLGEGPAPGQKPDLSGVGKVDAVVISHQHPDHFGALDLLDQIGDPPVYMTKPVWDVAHAKLAGHISVVDLPFRGEASIEGVPVLLGRTGHAPGGVWVHFPNGNGFTYMNDHKIDSLIFAYDAPPPADAMVLDASYGADDKPMADYLAAFDAVFDGGPVLMPVPVAGRGVEIALHLIQTGRPLPAIDAAMRALLEKLSGPWSDIVHGSMIESLAKLAVDAPSIDENSDIYDGVMVVGGGNGQNGVAAALCERWAKLARPAIQFSGYLGPGTLGATLVEAGRAQRQRWPVHATLSENIDLVQKTRAKQVVPGFSDAEESKAVWKGKFAPSKVTLDKNIEVF
ncbi:MAG: MBL fold metallo-hydrolase [Proteobacteria bacterium]|nr:MBL fold metallo-hydrolase [Pseudomonadota bacterium]